MSPNASEAVFRQNLRSQLLRDGVPAHAVDQIVALGMSTCETAVTAFKTTLAAEDDFPIMLCATGIAASLLIQQAQALLSSAISFGQERGLPIKINTISVTDMVQ